MAEGGIFRRVDAVTVPVPDLEAGLRFYGQALGHRLKWRNDAVGQAGLELPDGDNELVLTTPQSYQPDWLVDSVDDGSSVPPLPDCRRFTALRVMLAVHAQGPTTTSSGQPH